MNITHTIAVKVTLDEVTTDTLAVTAEFDPADGNEYGGPEVKILSVVSEAEGELHDDSKTCNENHAAYFAHFAKYGDYQECDDINVNGWKHAAVVEYFDQKEA